MSGMSEKGKSITRQKDDGVVRAISEENDLFDIILNKFTCLSVHTAFTVGGFLEMSFQSALSAVSNYSNYELLLSDRTEVYIRFLTHAFAKFSNVHSLGLNMKAGSQKLSQFG